MTRDAEYLHQIPDALTQIEEYVSVGRDHFMSGRLWQDATIRQLIVIGEATKRVSAELKAKYPDVSRREAAGLRDFLIHHYSRIDLSIVWQATQESLPAYKADVLAIVRAEGIEWNPGDG